MEPPTEAAATSGSGGGAGAGAGGGAGGGSGSASASASGSTPSPVAGGVGGGSGGGTPSPTKVAAAATLPRVPYDRASAVLLRSLSLGLLPPLEELPPAACCHDAVGCLVAVVLDHTAAAAAGAPARILLRPDAYTVSVDAMGIGTRLSAALAAGTAPGGPAADAAGGGDGGEGDYGGGGGGRWATRTWPRVSRRRCG